jgi:molybdopterin/thiamine biosynthesis adenylyltransferase
VAHLFQVGVGSGGMPVLDMLCRDERIARVTIVEPDVFKPHNVVRHIFPPSAVGKLKADLAQEWLHERRPELQVDVLRADLLDPAYAAAIDAAVQQADIGICAADNESAKYHFDGLMRRWRRPWTLGEVLSGGIGGFVHWFVPDGPCYGCVASHLKRSIAVDKPKTPDYSQPEGALPETVLPASKASIEVIASLHALITLQLLASRAPSAEPFDPSFTSMLLPLQRVPDVFAEPFRPFRFRIARSPDCLICWPAAESVATEDLDAAVDQALRRLGHG